ncbi:MAG TPA: LysR family transcriptional regulator [Myxococcaceae bacterium]|nr:LysR family transcriptional regulator [Myxococcaceae bacterium]
MVRLEDMRLFAAVAEERSFTRAGQRLGLPKQTVSRRIAELEEALGASLLQRTTRAMRLTEVGAAYASRCAELVRLAEEANGLVLHSREEPRGTLRITADPHFGESFLSGLLLEYAQRHAEVQLEVLLTRRRVELVEEGFDVAFRIGRVEDSSLVALSLGPARIRYCASRAYLARHGTPSTPEELRQHECIALTSERGPDRWPFLGPQGVRTLAVSGRLRFNSFALARQAVLAGLGIAIFPEFDCAAELQAGRLVSVLDDYVPDVGSIFLVYPRERYLSARVRTFVDLAVERLGQQPPWRVEEPVRARARSPG